MNAGEIDPSIHFYHVGSLKLLKRWNGFLANVVNIDVINYFDDYVWLHTYIFKNFYKQLPQVIGWTMAHLAHSPTPAFSQCRDSKCFRIYFHFQFNTRIEPSFFFLISKLVAYLLTFNPYSNKNNSKIMILKRGVGIDHCCKK